MDSMAYVVAAMKEIFLATSSCSPTGRPHCTRSRAHSRAILVHHLPAETHIAGRESRPVLSVVRAIFRPWPSSPMR
ncbi:Secreted protein [Nocardiopsis rhodophaea]